MSITSHVHIEIVCQKEPILHVWLQGKASVCSASLTNELVSDRSFTWEPLLTFPELFI